MSFEHSCFLFVVAMLGGALNSVAGGAGLIFFPALLFTGLPPISANATTAVASLPGYIASICVYRHEFKAQSQMSLLLGSTSLVGGILGAILLLSVPNTWFDRLVPWLLLLATLLFTFSDSITTRLQINLGQVSQRGASQFYTLAVLRGTENFGLSFIWVMLLQKRNAPSQSPKLSLFKVLLIQLLIAVYGGFYGGGMSFLILATLGILGIKNIHEMNALKILVMSCINSFAIVAFTFANIVAWPQAALMMSGTLVGGYGGANLAHYLEPSLVRYFVIVIGFTMTGYFFVFK